MSVPTVSCSVHAELQGSVCSWVRDSGADVSSRELLRNGICVPKWDPGVWDFWKKVLIWIGLWQFLPDCRARSVHLSALFIIKTKTPGASPLHISKKCSGAPLSFVTVVQGF